MQNAGRPGLTTTMLKRAALLTIFLFNHTLRKDLQEDFDAFANPPRQLSRLPSKMEA
jgi:hypothetical protein